MELASPSDVVRRPSLFDAIAKSTVTACLKGTCQGGRYQ